MTEIVILGPESTGKTRLAKQLSTHFQGCLVEEYSREYLENQNNYNEGDLLEIAKGQLELQEVIRKECKKKGNSIIFHDTDLFVIKIWSEYKYGRCNPWIIKQLSSRILDFYLLTYPDLPWEPDPLRENPMDREEIFNLYLVELKNLRADYKIIEGQGSSRTQMAIEAVEKF